MMGRTRRRAAAGALALGLAVVTGGSSSAAATAQVNTGVVFSTPSGTPAQQNAIETRLTELIDGAAPGSTMRIALYFLRDGGIVDALIRAHRDRGVGVQVIVDERNTWEPPREIPLAPGQTRVRNPGIAKLEQTLGTNVHAPSYLLVCTAGGACVGKLNSPKNHNKFYLFSDTLGVKNVIVQGSGNISPNTRLTNFNEAVTFTGNSALYAAYLSYFNDLAAMRKTGNYYRTATAGPVKAYYYPRRGKTPWEAATDDVYQVLDHVTCTGNAKVGTSSHHTIVRVDSFEINRSDIAHKLYDLDARGCSVEIIYTSMSATAEKILTAKAGKYHGPVLRCSKYRYPVRDASGRPVLDAEGSQVKQGAYSHEKYVLIEGVYYGVKDKKIILTGSHNLSYSALRENDETLLRIADPTLYAAYRRNFVQTRSLLATYHAASISGCRNPSTDVAARRVLPPSAERELERDLQDEYEN